MTAFARMVAMPVASPMMVMSRSFEIERTMVFVKHSTPAAMAFFIQRFAYSGPVSSSLNSLSPNPVWMHCGRMPPSS